MRSLLWPQTSIFLRNHIRGNDSVQKQGWPSTCRILLKKLRDWRSKKRRIYTTPAHRVIFKINQILVWNQEIPSNELISCWGCFSKNWAPQCGDTGSGFACTPTLKASDILGYITDVMIDHISVMKILLNFQDLVLFPLSFTIYNIILVHCIVWKIICYGLI